MNIHRIMNAWVFVSCLFLCGAADGADGEQVLRGSLRVSLITDLTGPGAYWGRFSAIGAQMAVEDLKRDGQAVSLAIGDHHFNTAATASEVQKALAVEHADAVMVDFGPPAIAASPLLAAAGKLFLNTSVITSLLKANPYAFKAYLDFEVGCRSAARYWKSQGIERIGMLTADTEFAELCLTGAKSVFPDILVESYNFGEPVRSQVLALKTKGAQAVLNSALEGDMINMLKAMELLKYKVPVANSEPDGFTDKVKAEWGRMLHGAVSFGFPDVPRDFLERVRSRASDGGGAGIEGAALSYSHLIQIVRAVSMCKQDEVNCQVQRLSESPPDPLIGFRGWKERIADYDLRLKRWNGNTPELIEQ